MSSFSNSTHRLEGAGSEPGGLIIKSRKKPEDKDADSTFKKPSGSRLGLDLLARRKREQRQAEEETKNTFSEKKLRLDTSRDIQEDDSDVRISFGRSDVNKDRRYRGTHVETPSHPGGVSDEALERFHTHVRKGSRSGDTGVYASTKSRSDRNRDGRGQERDMYSSRKRDDRDKSERRRRRGDEERMSERSRGNDWERETPQYDVGTGDTPYSRLRGNKILKRSKVYFCSGVI